MHRFRLRKSQREQGSLVSSSRGGVSLLGEAGQEVAANIQNLALGKVGVDDLGPAYSVSPSGTIGIRISSVSLSALAE